MVDQCSGPSAIGLIPSMTGAPRLLTSTEQFNVLRSAFGAALTWRLFSNAKAEGRETINGQSTIKISGNVTADAVNKIAPSFNATQPTPATVWIQESGDHQLVQANLQKSSGNSVQMTVSNWGQPVTVTKPPVNQ